MRHREFRPPTDNRHEKVEKKMIFLETWFDDLLDLSALLYQVSKGKHDDQTKECAHVMYLGIKRALIDH